MSDDAWVYTTETAQAGRIVGDDKEAWKDHCKQLAERLAACEHEAREEAFRGDEFKARLARAEEALRLIVAQNHSGAAIARAYFAGEPK